MGRTRQIILNIFKILPLILIFSVIITIYWIYYYEYLIILKNNTKFIYYFNFLKNFKNKYEIFLYITISLIFIVLLCIIKIIFTNPGNIPLDWHEKNYDIIIKELLDLKNKKENNGIFKNFITINTIKEVNNNDKDFKNLLIEKNMRFCKVCKLVKPARSHHCKQCNICILKMDHHCNWVYNCIGFKNYKYFLLLIFYLEFLLIFICFTFTECFLLAYFSNEISSYNFLKISINYFACIVFLSWVSFLFGFHFFRLSNNNITTIEFCEKKNKTEDYDIGLIKNLASVFGYNPFLWFIPINSQLKNSGINFKKSEDNTIPIESIKKI